jgi:hypothetical protein
MISPISYKPIVLQSDYANGAITRYFVKNISRHTIIEVDDKQYDMLKNNVYYTCVTIPWVIRGNLFTTTINDNPVLSIEEQNKRIVEFYSKRMPGLKRRLKNLMEFAIVTVNTSTSS